MFPNCVHYWVLVVLTCGVDQLSGLLRSRLDGATTVFRVPNQLVVPSLTTWHHTNSRHSRQCCVSHPWYYRNDYTSLLRQGDIEQMEDRGDANEEPRLCKIPSRAYPAFHGAQLSEHPDLSNVETLSFSECTYLLPYPKAKFAGSRTSGSSVPSMRKRSGLKRSGSGYTSGSCKQALFANTSGRAV